MATYKEYRHRDPSDKLYSESQSVESQKKRTNGFYNKWGLKATELAKDEGVHCATIHMRVQNYGTPFQRKAKPTATEILHDKTTTEIAIELNLHPQSVRVRIRKYNDAYNEGCKQGPNQGEVLGKGDWRQWQLTKSDKFWLHPRHPDYPASRGDKFYE